jgi:phospholipid-translocating ATPase
MEGILCFKRLKPGYRIDCDGSTVPYNNRSNKVDNRKYTWFSFVPLILYNQFSFFFNLYFLFLCITQLIPAFKVGFMVTYVGPLIFVIGLTMINEGIGDFKRYRRDKKVNEELFLCLERKPGPKKGTFVEKQSKEIKVGDVLLLEKGDRVPADMIILATKQSNGVVYLKTDQLDGETDWKVRESLKFPQTTVNNGELITTVSYTINVPRPSNKIYDFRGLATFSDNNTTEALRIQHTAWASTTVAAGDFYGVVCYVGKDTRIQMNASDTRIKFPQCDYEINKLSKILFCVCLVLSFFLVFMKGLGPRWSIEWVQFLVLLCCLIPQSLRTNLDIVKMIYSYRINKDLNIEGAICRNSQIVEDLGRIDYLLTDKTGTLTRNEMVFKKITTGVLQYTEEEFTELKKIMLNCDVMSNDKVSKKHQDLGMLMYSLILCNNVQPYIDSEGSRFLQSSSPDEIALVEFAEQMGFFIEFRDREKIIVNEPTRTGQVDMGGCKIVREYQILDNFPFSSARKRMGIVLKITSTKMQRKPDQELEKDERLTQHTQSKILFMLKGADTAIQAKVSRNSDLVVEEADNLAREGLRTLAFCYKWIEEKDYNAWKDKLETVKKSIKATEEEEERVVEELETDMKWVGISGVEDLLQDDVRETIESLREANIKVWVLTGDKIETAKCIAKSTGLKQKSENFFEMVEEDSVKIENQVNMLLNKKDVLIVQGGVLAKIFERRMERLFFKSVQHLPAIMFCRCSPTQKALVVKSVQNILHYKSCAIGKPKLT